MEKCEMCLENHSEMDFNYALPSPHKFTEDVSDNPHIFSAMICFDCFGSALSDAHIVIAVANKRKEKK